MNNPINISDITRFIIQFGSRRAKNLFRLHSRQTKIKRLARKFALPGKRNEEAWAREIVGSDTRSQAYVMIRSQLKLRLLDHLFNLDLKKGSQIRRALYRTMKRTFMARVLVFLGARKAAMSLVPAALKWASKFEFTHERIELLRLSRTDASLNGRSREFEKIDRELAEVLRLRVAENRIVSLQESLDVQIVGHGTISRRLKKMALPASQEAFKIYSAFHTFNVGLNYYRISATTAEVLDRYKETLRICEEAENFLARYPHLSSAAFESEFALKQLVAALSVRSYNKAVSAAKLCRRLFTEGSNNWFIALEYEFLLYMHCGRFAAADSLLKATMVHGRFESQSEQVRQKWVLFRQFAEFKQISKLAPVAKKMKLDEFLDVIRDIPIYSKDKVGFNSSLLILHYLVLLDCGKLNEILSRTDAIGQYLSHHFRMRKAGQQYAFLKCLVALEKYDFDLARCQRRLARYITQFSTGYVRPEEAQVLPYSELWELITDSLARIPKAKLAQFARERQEQRDLSIQ